MLKSLRQRFRIGMLRQGATRMTCREARCENERNGWTVVLDPLNPKQAAAARWIEGDSGREYVRLYSETAIDWLVGHGAARGITLSPTLRGILDRTPPGMLVFLFPPGQQCFKPHLDREVVFAHDKLAPSGAPVATRVHVRPENYMEHWNEESDRVNAMLRRG